MGSLRRLLRSLAGLLRDAPDPAREAALLQAHRERCLNFRVLLAANNRALELMGAMQEALRGPRAFGMNFVRASCTAVSAEVLRMARALCALAPGRYEALLPRHAAIAGRLEALLAPGPPPAPGPLVLPVAALRAADAPRAGGKAAMLGELGTLPGVRVPRGFVVTVSGFAAFMAHQDLRVELERLGQTQAGSGLDGLYSLSAALQQRIVATPLPPALGEALAAGLAELLAAHGPGLRLAVRSSAVGEDAAQTSFAGQYRSELNVHPDSLGDVYRDVVASLYGATAMAYRLGRGLRDEDVPMAVLVLPMVPSLCGGVAYTANPLDAADRTLTVSAVHGLPKAVVDGSDAADTWLLARGPQGPELVRAEHTAQETAYVPGAGEGLERELLDAATAGRPTLEPEAVLRLARLALAVEAHCGGPQDIEWALEPDGEFTLLQARPLGLAAGDGSGAAQAPAAAAPPPAAEGSDGPSVLYRGGVTASSGIGSGPVRVARRPADALGFPEGAVLVAPLALPEWAPLLSRAAALVCERGGVTGHLATVAREFAVPALFACQGAVAALPEGGEVTVDADAAVILAGRREVAPQSREPRRSPIHGSPVHQALDRAAELVVPLRLLDPQGEGFRPEACATLHDITRFCHEKAVAEMFDPDNALPLPEGAARRLVCGVPMQYWVVDLGGGLARAVDGPTVTLDDIACAPMLALWRGMTAQPWAGPPPVNARGFLSVLAEATANPDLEAAAASRFSERNYFMISKTFCNLHSRFGFHFSIVEAEAGEDPGGNHVSLRFNGGAADRQRRELRARFIAGLLEERGMRVDVTGDALAARAEALAAPRVLELLEVLGYLVIHTRQLDMIMADPVESARRTRAVRDGLLALAGGSPRR
jgi:pyruvate,water dikinase